MVDQLNELGFYALAGAPESPRDMIGELQAAEKLGINRLSMLDKLIKRKTQC